MIVNYTLIIIFAFMAFEVMETYARLAHKHLWHGFLWSVHSTHHKHHESVFEWNDIFGIFNALVFAPLTIHYHSVFTSEQTMGTASRLGILVGISLCGVSYIIIHDGLYHHRFPCKFLCYIPLFRRTANLHSIHHTKNMGPPFGLWKAHIELEYHKVGMEYRVSKMVYVYLTAFVLVQLLP